MLSVGVAAAITSVAGESDGVLEMSQLQAAHSEQPAREVSRLRAWLIHEGGLDATPIALAEPMAAPEALPDVPRVTQDAPAAISPEALIRATFGEHGEEALKVGRCESGDDLHAEPWENPNHRGPFQVSYVHAWRYVAHGWDWDTATDAQHVMIALEIWLEQGASPWRFSATCHGVY